jgi:glycosyltransferase involved in cell wall biosynthesis
MSAHTFLAHEADAPATWVALLGRRDEPTDGVADYCEFLSRALRRRDIELRIVRVPWVERGWPEALRWLAGESRNWKVERVLLQYTALGWSRRGFPFGAARVLNVLRKRGVRCTVVFHDRGSASGTRIRDGLRRAAQTLMLRRMARQSEHSVFTTPLGNVAWLPKHGPHAAFIPIGANVPECRARRLFDASRSPKTVAVFSVTEGKAGAQEVGDIVLAVRHAAQHAGPIRLEVFGRGAEEAAESLTKAFQGSPVELRVRGVIPAEEITRTLASADVSLCVRGLTASNRGTSIAGIACGVPLVGYGQAGSDPAIDAAGIRMAPWHEPAELAGSLVEVLTDAALWQGLHDRNLQAQERYFSWAAVAGRYVELHATNRERPA